MTGPVSADGPGRQKGAELVRSHRLWEQYLASEAGESTQRLHQQAEKLEHFTGRELRERLDQQTSTPHSGPSRTTDPSEDQATLPGAS